MGEPARHYRGGRTLKQFSNDCRSPALAACGRKQAGKNRVQKVPTIGKIGKKFSNDWKNHRFCLPTIGTLLLLVFPAFGDLAGARQDVDADIAHVQAALQTQREQIAAERRALVERQQALQADVRRLRDEWRDVQRVTQHREAERAAARRRAEQTQAEHRHVANLIAEFRRATESRMSAVDVQRYEAYLAALDGAIQADEASGATLSAVEPALDLLARLVWTDLATRPFSGTALDADGRVLAGQWIAIGPEHIFVGADGLVGYRSAGMGGLDPVLTVEVPASVRRGWERWATQEQVVIPLDVSAGALLKIQQARVSLPERLRQGGIIMIPLLGIGLVCVVMIVRRWLGLRRMEQDVDAPVTDMLTRLESGDETRAREIAESLRDPWRPVLLDAVAHWRADPVYLEEVLQDRIIMQAPRVQQYLGALAICAAAAPLLGLLGTVTGMIHTFQLITVFGTGDARSLSGGISEALITTQTGLVIAVPVLLAHAYLSRRAKGILAGLEHVAIRFVRAAPSGRE